ncbi:hypothetical protein IV203_027115 [Nitzschia inconspicua]|uniref:Uncharacterized protein n=1 Tax=Nitzschia inconspicua TaxID=303405 RepID=A0A9K3LJX1_9STRA|nr:hypothetical protein IV203_027115 [Nitzschia inconspicua]
MPTLPIASFPTWKIVKRCSWCTKNWTAKWVASTNETCNPLMATEILNKLYLKFTPAEEENLENFGYVGESLMNRLDSLSANVFKLYLKSTPAEEENLENLGYVGELLMNRLDSLSANVLNHLNLGASFYLHEVVSIMARYNQVPDESMAAYSAKVEVALEVAVENRILFFSTTSSCLNFLIKRELADPLIWTSWWTNA